jgi:hypothetical protein
MAQGRKTLATQSGPETEEQRATIYGQWYSAATATLRPRAALIRLNIAFTRRSCPSRHRAVPPNAARLPHGHHQHLYTLADYEPHNA